MSYIVGQQVTIPITVTVNGVPTNATVTVVVTRPDGSTLTPTVGTTGTGQYQATVLADQPSLWGYVATISGTATGEDAGEFYVTSSAARIVSLREVKKHLNKDLADTTDDEELSDVLDAAQDMIVRDYGPVLPTVVIERQNGGGPKIILRKRPVRSVTSVVSTYNGSPSTIAAGGYVLDSNAGILTRVGANGWPAYWEIAGYESLTVTYTAGPSVVKQSTRLAAKELTAHMWRNTQLGRTRRSRSGAEDEGAAAQLGFSMPYRVRELLGVKPSWVF